MTGNKNQRYNYKLFGEDLAFKIVQKEYYNETT